MSMIKQFSHIILAFYFGTFASVIAFHCDPIAVLRPFSHWDSLCYFCFQSTHYPCLYYHELIMVQLTATDFSLSSIFLDYR